MDAIELDVTPPRDAVVGRRAVSGFDELYATEYAAMVRLAYLLVRDREVATEVTHDAFARVLERWERLERPGGYLRTAVVNGSRDALRRRIFRRSRHHVAGRIDLTTPAPDDYLADALGRLQPRRRAAIVLRYYLDLPEAEIAATLGVRPGTVKSLLHRGLADLRAELSDQPDDDQRGSHR